MAKKASGPSIDYYELRRRHEEYKKKQEEARRAAESQERPAEGASPAISPAPQAAEAPVQRSATVEAPAERPVQRATRENDIPVQEAPPEDIPVQEAPAEDVPVQEAPATAGDSAPISENFADEDGGEAFDGDDSKGNPFAFAIRLGSKLKNFIESRHAKDDLPLDDSDDSYVDGPVGEFPEEKGGAFRFLRRRRDAYEPEAEETLEGEEAYDGDAYREAPTEYDIEDNPSSGEAQDVPEGGEPAFDAEDIPQDDSLPESPAHSFSESFEADMAEHDGQYEETYEDEEASPRSGAFKRFINLFIVRDDVYDEDDIEVEDGGAAVPAGGFDDSLFIRPRDYADNEEVVLAMDEQDKKTLDMSELMAEGIGDKTMSRRERREMRERQAASANNIDEADDASTIPDEPTREYTIVSRPGARGEDINFFDDEDNPEPVPTVQEDDEDYDDEEEDKKPVRKSLFGKSRTKSQDYDDEDDYDGDYDDDYDDEDDYDEDYDYDEPVKKTRSKSRRMDDLDDDDYDDYDDDYDDEDDSPSVGHYVLGVIKVLIAIALIAVIAVFGLYFADQALDGGVPAYDWLRERAPFLDSVLPVNEPAAAVAPEITAEPAQPDEPTEEPAASEPTAEPAQAEPTEEPAAAPAG